MAQYDLILTQNVHASGTEYQEKIVNIAKGGLLSANVSSAPTILAAGTNGYVLIRDDVEATGLKWVDPSTVGGSSDVSVTNQANNRVITATATTDVLNAESGLTYDGSTLSVTGNIVQTTVRILSGSGNAFIYNETSQDVRIGINAGNETMTHTYPHVLIGSGAGYNLSSADANVFIGHLSGQQASTGSYNVGVGAYTLSRVAAGTQNLGLGAQSLRNFTGNGNIGIGYAAGTGVSGSSTGSYNTFIGTSSGFGVTTGGSNVFVGYNTGTRVVTNSNNVYLGTQAGQYNSGADNIFIGTQAGRGVDGSSTGGNNIFIGGYAGTATTTGQYNLLIGYHVDASSATATYDFRLGYDTTFLLQGNMAGGSQWVGTDYVFRTDYLEEFTASAGITVQDHLLINSTNRLRFYDSASVYFTAENDSVFDLYLGNLKKFQFSQAASAAYFKFYLDPTTDVYGYILATNTDYTATYTAGPKSTGIGVGVKLYGGDTAAAGEKGGDVYIRGGISGSGGAASIVNIQSPLTLSGIASATASEVLYYNAGVITHGAAPAGGSTYWSKSGTNLSPLTVGDDVLLPYSDRISWGDGNAYVTTRFDGLVQWMDFYVSSTQTLWLSQNNVWVTDNLKLTDSGAGPWTITNTAGNVTASHSIATGSTGFSLTWSGGGSSSVTATHYGGDLILKGGDQTGTGGGHGGNVYLYGGSSVSSSRGNIYLGSGSSGYLPAKGSETNVVYYDTATGKLSYGAAGGSGMIYPGAGIVVSTGSAWGTSIVNNSANWDTAYSWGDHASAGYQPGHLNLTSLAALVHSSTSFVKMTAPGTFALDTNAYSLTSHAHAESAITFTDITTNNATTSKHGYLPKLSGSTSEFLRGDGTWVPVVTVTDHGALSGLTDDDHTQYYNQTRGDARYSLTGHTHLNYAPLNVLISSKTTAYTVQSSDNNKIIECSGTFTVTLPDGMTTGFQVTIVNVSTGTITIAATTTLYSKNSNTKLASRWIGATAYHQGSNVWILMGDLTA
jgi:hypothetical protein